MTTASRPITVSRTFTIQRNISLSSVNTTQIRLGSAIMETFAHLHIISPSFQSTCSKTTKKMLTSICSTLRLSGAPSLIKIINVMLASTLTTGRTSEDHLRLMSTKVPSVQSGKPRRTLRPTKMVANWSIDAGPATVGKNLSTTHKATRHLSAGLQAQKCARRATVPTTTTRKSGESHLIRVWGRTSNCTLVTVALSSRRQSNIRSTSCPHCSTMTNAPKVWCKVPTQHSPTLSNQSMGVDLCQSQLLTHFWCLLFRGVVCQSSILIELYSPKNNGRQSTSSLMCRTCSHLTRREFSNSRVISSEISKAMITARITFNSLPELT